MCRVYRKKGFLSLASRFPAWANWAINLGGGEHLLFAAARQTTCPNSFIYGAFLPTLPHLTAR